MYWHMTSQWNKTESLEKPKLIRSINFKQKFRLFSEERKVFSTNSAETPSCPHGKNKPQLLPLSICKH